MQGDLGRSLLSSQPVLDLILQRMPNTILIAAYALVLAALVGIPLGVLAATRSASRARCLRHQRRFARRRAAELLARDAARSAPCRSICGLVPGDRARVPFSATRLVLKHATLPAIALAVGVIAELARQVRSALIEVLARNTSARCAPRASVPIAILWKHGLRNISVTLLTLLGLQVNRLLSGAVVIEAVFAIPGAGKLVAYSAINKDFPVVQGVVLVLVIMVILINLLVDILSALLDPRVAEAT